MIREKIQQTDEYAQITAQQEQEQGDQGQSNRQRSRREADTVGDALAPLLDAEKGDIQFWTQVLQLLVLLAILRELQRGA
jgi:hypothetical protein